MPPIETTKHRCNTATSDPYQVIYVDKSILVVSKPSRLLSVPGRGDEKKDCLISRIQLEFPDALIVHRLDYDTSGLLVLARGQDNHRKLSIAFQERLVEKEYVAIVAGSPNPTHGAIDLPLIVDWPNRPLQKVDLENGKPSRTNYETIPDSTLTSQHSRLRLKPETGRTHQLRVHCLSMGHPILGDPLYGTTESQAAASRLQLHAEHLCFKHPIYKKEMSFVSKAPF